MKWRVARCLVAVLLVQFVCTAPVWAKGKKDDMSFGEGEVEKVDKNNPVFEFLEEGKKLYRKKNYVEASLLFHKVIQKAEDDKSAEPFLAEAKYELGKSLFRMELYQGALDYFGQIVDEGQSHPYYLPTLRGLVLLSDEIPSDSSLVDRLTTYVQGFPKDVPKKYRQQYAFLVGRHLYNQGQYEQALKLLKTIRGNNAYFVRARYIMGVTHVANYSAKKALKSFKEVLRILLPKQEAGELTADEESLLEMNHMAIARLFYSTGSYNKALQYYNKISHKSQNWAPVLFETSWSFFQLDLANKALGNLHTLNSPFFANAYFPEAPILAAVIFFYNCKYSRVRYELEEFELSYLPLKDDIEALVAKYKDNDTGFFDWLEMMRKGVSGEDERLKRILAASLDDKQILRKLELLKAIGRETQKINAAPASWSSSALHASLKQDNEVALSLAKGETGALVRMRLQRVLRELVDFNVNRERILFEVARAEKGEIDADMRAEMVVDKDVKGGKGIQVSDEELHWTFEGEYWKDELGFYFFNINTECKR